MNILNNSAIIGLITAALYFFGFLEDSLFLTTLGFPVGQFVKKPESLIYDGFMTVISGQSSIVIVYFISTLAAVYALLFLMGKKFEFFSKAITRFDDYAKKYGIIVGFVFLIILFNIAGSEALDKGINRSDRLQSDRRNTHEVHFSGSSRELIKGRLVRVSPTLNGCRVF